MNAQLKTVLLTILTLSVFTIALVELSGVSTTALVNKYGGSTESVHTNDPELSEIEKKKDAIKDLPKTTIAFTETKHDFGNIKEGEVVKHAYHFKNTGTNPLIIANAVASCGCTVPSYPKEPIAPGGEGDIMVEFNSHNREGHQQKNIMIYSNAQEDAMSIGFDVDVKK